MFKSDREIANDVNAIADKTIVEACRLLEGYEGDLRRYLAEITAAVCGVEIENLLTDTKRIESSQSRWLYWYAYRYMTNESYESMSNKTRATRYFVPSCVAHSIAKMTMLINEEGIWMKRWTFLRRVIRIILDKDGEEELFQRTIKLRVQTPKGINVELEKD